MPDFDSIQLLVIMAAALGTFIATALQAWYKKLERDERRRGARYQDISQTGFDLLDETYRRRTDRVLDFDGVLKDIDESRGLSDQQKTDDQLRAESALETLVRTDCLRKRDGDGNLYAMTERGLQVREYHHQNRWWKIWMRPPL